MIIARQHRRYRIAAILAVVVAAAALVTFHGWAHFRAVTLLLRMQNPQDPGALARVTADSVASICGIGQQAAEKHILVAPRLNPVFTSSARGIEADDQAFGTDGNCFTA
jgi:hypothetical protein